ncbi:hypothetical protein KW789_01905 [Candidatus Saccharibacteria bacterium]|nr:hypothetical protein [Candidatus Saccharibacteria bacterium]
MFGNNKLNLQTKVTLAVVLLIILAAAGYALFVHNNKTTSHDFVSELVYADPVKGQLYITDKDGKQLSKTAYPKFTSLAYQAVAPNGGVLVSLHSGTDKESFIFTRNNAAKSFPAGATNQLRLASHLQTSHQIFFEDEKNILLVSCADSKTSCVLNRLDLSNDKITKIIDTGAKQANASFPTAYLVGYSSSVHTAYLRIVGADNKLGKATSAVYKIDTYSSKVTGKVDFPAATSPALALSPDSNKLAYISVESGNKATINILDLEKNKTQKIQWDKGLISTLPGALKWSPDSKRLLVQTISIGVSIPGASGKSLPLVVAYIDISKDGSVNVLQEINDPSHQTLSNLGWLDNDTVVYQLKSTSKAYDFSGASNQTLKLDIGSKSSNPLKVPAGDLLQAINY